MESYDIYDEDFSGTIFEDIDDLDVMYFINDRIRGKTLIMIENDDYIYNNNYDDMYKGKTTPTAITKTTPKTERRNDYYYFMINRLNTLIYVFPNTDMEMLYKIANIEWNNMYAKPNCFSYIFP